MSSGPEDGGTGAAGAPTTVLVVDDNPSMRSGLVSLLHGTAGIVVVGAAEDGEGAVRLVGQLRPDVTLLDVRMPGMDGVTAAAAVSASTRVVMLTSTEDEPTVQRALGTGIAGYLVHGSFAPADLPRMVLDVAAGGGHMSSGPAAIALREAAGGGPRRRALCEACAISDREAEVMGLIATGLSNADVAAALFLSPKTVKNHVNRIFAKLGARDRGHAIATWLGSAAVGAPSGTPEDGPPGPTPIGQRSVVS